MAFLARALLLQTAVLGGLLSIGFASACSTADDEGPVARPPRPLPGATTPPTEGDTTSVPLPSPGACEELGSLVGETGSARYVSSDVRSLSLSLANRPVTSRIAVVGVGTRTDLLGKDVTLGAAENANYETCTHCLVIAVGCTTDCSTATWFYPRTGTATFTAVPSVSGDMFKGKFTDVILQQVHVDFDTGASTPVVSGACFHVDALEFDAVATSAPLPGSSTSSSGGSTSSSGSTTSSSSGSTTSSSGGSTSSSGGTGTSGGTGGGGGGGDKLAAKRSI